MSTRIMSACWPLEMPPTPKAVLISLADNANDEGECWPSLATISERTCFSERAVQNAIKWLESASLITADRSNGRHTRYHLTPAAYSTPAAGATPARRAPKPPQQVRVPPHDVRQPPQQVPSNRKEPSRTVKSNRKRSPSAGELMPELPEALLMDYLAVRKAKRLALTETAVDGLRREADKAGISFVDAIRTCCERGWGGFNADWVGGSSATVPVHERPGGGRRAL